MRAALNNATVKEMAAFEKALPEAFGLLLNVSPHEEGVGLNFKIILCRWILGFEIWRIQRIKSELK